MANYEVRIRAEGLGCRFRKFGLYLDAFEWASEELGARACYCERVVIDIIRTDSGTVIDTFTYRYHGEPGARMKP